MPRAQSAKSSRRLSCVAAGQRDPRRRADIVGIPWRVLVVVRPVRGHGVRHAAGLRVVDHERTPVIATAGSTPVRRSASFQYGKLYAGEDKTGQMGARHGLQATAANNVVLKTMQ